MTDQRPARQPGQSARTPMREGATVVEESDEDDDIIVIDQ
jgi:hypothetical protein